jgi:hypothetical protein
MANPALVSEADLLRARSDAAYRHQLVQDHLELLLASLNKLRSNKATARSRGAQIREGVEMAVRLADILHRLSEAGRP